MQRDDSFIEVKRTDKLVPPLLYDLLIAACPHGFEHFIVDRLPFKNDPRGRVDEKGNFIIRIGPENPTTMFSAHMDTVHSVTEACKKDPQNKMPQISILTKDPDKGKSQDLGYIWAGVKIGVRGGRSEFESINLGADDKAGVYLLCKLIEKGVPGLYVFHVGEEVGGVGSKFIVEKNPELVKGIKRCIAFDRRNVTDVIAHQRGGRTASNEFTSALAVALNEQTGVTQPAAMYKGDVHGLFTDTCNYKKLIPECTNVSCGYYNEHQPEERLDVYFLTDMLLPAVLAIDWEALPTARDPKAKETPYWERNDGSVWRGHYGAGNGFSKVDWPHLGAHTPIYDLPNWTPARGLVLNTPIRGMEKVVNEWVSRTSNLLVSEHIVGLMLKLEEANMQLDCVTQPGEEEEVEAEVVEVKKVEMTTTNAINGGGLPAVIPGPLTPSVVLQPPGEKALPRGTPEAWVSFEEPKSKRIWTLSKVEFVKRQAMKFDILNKIASSKRIIKLDRAYQLEFDNYLLKFDRIFRDHCKGGDEVVGYKCYTTLNRIVSKLVLILDKAKFDCPSKLSEAYIDGVHYLERYHYEPGLIELPPA